MKQKYSIAVLRGDGIGPEVVDAALRVLNGGVISEGVELEYADFQAGAELYKRSGVSMTDADAVAVGEADAVLLGAMGLPTVRKEDGTEIAPQIDLRERYGLFASLRPCELFPGVVSRVKADKVNMLVIRETTEGLFAGRHDTQEPNDHAVSDRLTITRATCEKLFRVAFEQAKLRRSVHGTPGHVTLLDKSNVLRSNAFMRKVFDEVAARYPEIGTDRIYIDAGSMMFVTNPERYDVVVTENVFGDITSEIAAGVVGGLGVAPSGDISFEHGIFQPSHGSAPDIAGKGVANPVATILSVAMMLEWLATKHDDSRCLRVANTIRRATASVLLNGPRTPDLGGTSNTMSVANAIVDALGI
jgi:3-isopropylmalate dehydrogenase